MFRSMYNYGITKIKGKFLAFNPFSSKNGSLKKLLKLMKTHG